MSAPRRASGLLGSAALARLVLALLVLALLVGCGGGGADAGPPDAGSGPREDGFGASILVQGGDEVTAVALFRDLTAVDELDLEGTLTLPPRSTVVHSPFDPTALFVLDGDAPRLTRYRVLAGGGFERELTLAFAALLTPTRFFDSENFVFLGPERAYLFDAVAAEVLVWNPAEMTLVDSFEVPTDQVPPGLLFPVVSQPVVLGSRVITPIAFADSTRDLALRTTLITVLDTETDRVESVLSTDECGYLLDPWLTADGDLLLGTGMFSTAVEVASEGARAGPSCVVRLDVETLTVEALAAPGELTDGRPAGSFLFVSDERAYARVLDESALPDTGQLTTLDLTSANVWRWGLVDLTEADAFRLLEDRPLRTGFSRVFTFDGQRYAIENQEDGGGSQVVELGVTGAVVPGVSTSQRILHLFPLQF